MGTNGGARRDRTADLLHAMQALSQLSYGPENEARNLRDALVPVKIDITRFPGLLIVNSRLIPANRVNRPFAAAPASPRNLARSRSG